MVIVIYLFFIRSRSALCVPVGREWRLHVP